MGRDSVASSTSDSQNTGDNGASAATQFVLARTTVDM